MDKRFNRLALPDTHPQSNGRAKTCRVVPLLPYRVTDAAYIHQPLRRAAKHTPMHAAIHVRRKVRQTQQPSTIQAIAHSIAATPSGGLAEMIKSPSDARPIRAADRHVGLGRRV